MNNKLILATILTLFQATSPITEKKSQGWSWGLGHLAAALAIAGTLKSENNANNALVVGLGIGVAVGAIVRYITYKHTPIAKYHEALNLFDKSESKDPLTDSGIKCGTEESSEKLCDLAEKIYQKERFPVLTAANYISKMLHQYGYAGRLLT